MAKIKFGMMASYWGYEGNFEKMFSDAEFAKTIVSRLGELCSKANEVVDAMKRKTEGIKSLSAIDSEIYDFYTKMLNYLNKVSYNLDL